MSADAGLKNGLFADYASYLAVGTVVAGVLSFVYVFRLLRSFGVAAEYFFLPSDYFGFSVGMFFYLVFFQLCFWVLFVAFYGVAMVVVYFVERDEAYIRLARVVCSTSMFFLMVGGFIRFLWFKDPGSDLVRVLVLEFLSFWVSFAVYLWRGKVLAKRLVLFVGLVMLVVSGYVVSVFAGMEHDYIVRLSATKERLHLADSVGNAVVRVDDMKIVCVNSRYFFLYDLRKKNVSIVPVDRVRLIEVVK